MEAGRLQILASPAKSAGEAQEVVEEEVAWATGDGFHYWKVIGKDGEHDENMIHDGKMMEVLEQMMGSDGKHMEK